MWLLLSHRLRQRDATAAGKPEHAVALVPTPYTAGAHGVGHIQATQKGVIPYFDLKIQDHTHRAHEQAARGAPLDAQAVGPRVLVCHQVLCGGRMNTISEGLAVKHVCMFHWRSKSRSLQA